MKPWTKLLPRAFVQWYAKRNMQTNTLGGRAGVWAYRDTFFTVPCKPQPIDPATLRPDADLADLGRPMRFQLLPNVEAQR
jgi:hypothetical protein